ncbi:hypothetical protein K502DRAFT_260482 [Neoconidiobolus thromboides FSU 785]|nr:hypothetical protein K502DRAFT_260482 [Neoconidiobolus thromboides FSU 785]
MLTSRPLDHTEDAIKYGRTRSLSINRPTSIQPSFLIKPSFLPACKKVTEDSWLQLDFYNEALFGCNWKIKDKSKNTLLKFKFETIESALLSTKDKSEILAKISNKRINSQKFYISLVNNNKLQLPNHSRSKSIGYFSNQSEANSNILTFTNPYQTDYHLKIADREYSWQPLLVNSDWVLVPVCKNAEDKKDSPMPLARFKRKVLNPCFGTLNLHCSFSTDDIHVILLSLAYIFYRHLKKPYDN